MHLTRYLARFAVTPNQISLFSFLCSIAAAALITISGYAPSNLIAHLCLAIGGLIAQFASVIDGCDGEIARLKFQQSDYGAWFDAVLDRYADALLLLAMTWRVYSNGDPVLGLLADQGSQAAEIASLVTGFLAIIGSFMISYTADKYDSLMRERLAHGMSIRIGRDIRVFLIFLGAVTNLAFPVLLVNAVVMNLEVIRRVWFCRHGK